MTNNNIISKHSNQNNNSKNTDMQPVARRHSREGRRSGGPPDYVDQWNHSGGRPARQDCHHVGQLSGRDSNENLPDIFVQVDSGRGEASVLLVGQWFC